MRCVFRSIDNQISDKKRTQYPNRLDKGEMRPIITLVLVCSYLTYRINGKSGSDVLCSARVWRHVFVCGYLCFRFPFPRTPYGPNTHKCGSFGNFDYNCFFFANLYNHYAFRVINFRRISGVCCVRGSVFDDARSTSRRTNTNDRPTTNGYVLVLRQCSIRSKSQCKNEYMAYWEEASFSLRVLLK